MSIYVSRVDRVLLQVRAAKVAKGGMDQRAPAGIRALMKAGSASDAGDVLAACGFTAVVEFPGDAKASGVYDGTRFMLHAHGTLTRA